MITVESISELRSQISQVRKSGRSIGFVPTMGALHRGHLSLVEIAKTNADFAVMSIFVNPIQFNSSEDLLQYPRTIERDVDQAASVGVDLLFLPKENEIYPDLYSQDSDRAGTSRISAGRASWGLEGPYRPGHFDGVTTVVGLLFNLVQPDVAIFGEKDFQQLRVIEEMVRDLRFPVRVIPAPLIRDNDGLALSSRNERLSPSERVQALAISKALSWAKSSVSRGQSAKSVADEIRRRLERDELKVDYVSIVDQLSLQELERIEGAAQVLIAAFVGQVRLIDNIAVSV